MALSGGAASAGAGGGGGADGVVRGELVDRGGRPTLVAVRKLRWGTQILSERPLLLVEADADRYLRAPDADPRLPELAAALGDAERLAAYVAFKQLHERKQKEFLGLWREGLERSDPLAARLHELNQRGAEMFVKDRPEFARLIYWHHFVLVAAILGRFGKRDADGSLTVHALCSQLRHSCRPNAARFTLRRGFPKGRQQLHVIAVDGIARGEEITVTEEPESILVLPRPERAPRLFGGSGLKCECARCTDGDLAEDARVGPLFSRLHVLLGVQPPTDESTAEALACVRELDKLLPFSMQTKARAKVLLASALSELSSRAAWQEESRGANIVRWTGLDPESQEQRLKDTLKLYETAAKDFELLLGQDALGILQRLEARYAPTRDIHKMLAKYNRAPPVAPAAAATSDPAVLAGAGESLAASRGGAGAGDFVVVQSKEGLPPGWDELFHR